MIKSLAITPLVILIFLRSIIAPQRSQLLDHSENILRGPILASISIGGGQIRFQDVGANHIWQVDLPNSSYFIYDWSPNGCQILLRGTSWIILSIVDSTIHEIPFSSTVGDLSSSVSRPIWTLDSRYLTFSIQPKANDPTSFYLLDLATHDVEEIFTTRKGGGAIRWLSNALLLYETPDNIFIVDVTTKHTDYLGSRPTTPTDWFLPFHTSYSSPNGELLARFYDPYRPKDDVDEEYFQSDEPIYQQPGFDIYSFTEGAIKHIDVNGVVLQSLVWSPSSKRIVVTTYSRSISVPDEFNGIYIYEVEEDALQKVDDFPSLSAPEYGPYIPSWSPDEEWLVFNTPTGFIIYHLTTQENVLLDQQFDGFELSLSWSPVMNYTNSACMEG